MSATPPAPDGAGRGAVFAWGAAFAVLLMLSFPFRAGDLQLDVGAVAGWIALVPLVRMLRGAAVGTAVKRTLIAATAAFSGILFWIYSVIHVYGQGPVWVALSGVGLLSITLALHTGVTAALYAWLRPRAGPLRLVVLPAAWVVGEHLRSFVIFGGFPWAYLGYAVHQDGPALEIASLVGVYGLSFLLASFAVLLAEGRTVAAMALVAVIHVVGFGLRLGHGTEPQNDSPPLRYALIQGSISQDQKWDRASVSAGFERHLELSRLAAEAGPVDLILWPETALPLLIEYEPDYVAELRALSRQTGAVIVLGGVGFERLVTPQKSPLGLDYLIFNSVFAVTPEAGFVDRYDKSHLVPFGEYIPLRAVLGSLSAVASGMAMGDATPGPGPRVLRKLGLEPSLQGLAPLICYEVIYPSLVREAVLGGARILLNLTNDAWYGRTSAPHQFLAIAAFRSAEHGLPMLRAANTGISAVVDAGGRVLRESPIFEQHALSGTLPPAREGPTPYTRWGDWIVGLSWAILIGLGGTRVVSRFRRDQRSHPRGSTGATGSSRSSGGATEASLTSGGNGSG